MDRRAFVGLLAAAGAASPMLRRTAAAQPAPRVRNVVLVHGLFADGSCWSEVIPRLQAAGLNATAVQNPLTTLEESVAAAQRALALQDGPTVLVGHSFSGMIVTEAGVDPKVTALVYVAARAPDAGEDYTALAKHFPTPPAVGGHRLVRRLGTAQRGGLSARFRRRPAGGEGARALRGSSAVPTRVARRQDDACGLAVEAELVCGLHRRPDDQSGSRAVHGEADGREDDRGEGKPPVADLPA